VPGRDRLALRVWVGTADELIRSSEGGEIQMSNRAKKDNMAK
jgi:hypothetical protein